MKNITGEGEAHVTEWDVLRLLKSKNIHFTPFVVAQELKARTADMKPLLEKLVATGEIFTIKDSKKTLYRHKCYRMAQQHAPAPVLVFKPLKYNVTAQGTREGSNDYLQWKSKHF